jgi:hypothetical protein
MSVLSANFTLYPLHLQSALFYIHCRGHHAEGIAGNFSCIHTRWTEGRVLKVNSSSFQLYFSLGTHTFYH